MKPCCIVDVIILGLDNLDNLDMLKFQALRHLAPLVFLSILQLVQSVQCALGVRNQLSFGHQIYQGRLQPDSKDFPAEALLKIRHWRSHGCAFWLGPAVLDHRFRSMIESAVCFSSHGPLRSLQILSASLVLLYHFFPARDDDLQFWTDIQILLRWLETANQASETILPSLSIRMAGWKPS